MIPGMPGGYLESTDVLPRPENVNIFIEANSMANLQKLKEDLAAWLITDQPQELIFDDEPDRIYYAVVDGSLDLEELVKFGQGTITFICPDPYKYGTEKMIKINGASSFKVNGTAETEPTIKVTLKKDTTFVAVSNGDKLNMIGMPFKVEQTPVDPETQVFKNTNLTGWTIPAQTQEDSEITGILKTSGKSFYSDNYGLGAGWHGPSMKTSFGTTVKDFRFDVGFRMIATGANQAGGIVVSLLDTQNRVVAKVQMVKHFGNLYSYYSRLRAGFGQAGIDIIPESGPAIFNDTFFQGVFRMLRIGNVWTAAIYKMVNGVFQSPYLVNWVDSNKFVTADVAQIQVQLLQRFDFPVVDQWIDDIYLLRQNNVNANQVPYVAKVGDVIEFDQKTNIIRRNGEDITKEKAFIGEYFPLIPGLNTIVAEPADCIEKVEVRWRDKWR
jgi:predicted phage tail component-like protein